MDNTELPSFFQFIMKSINVIPFLQTKMQELHKAVRESQWEKARELMQDGKLVRAADRTGLPPLQTAVVLGLDNMVENIVKAFPESVKLTDNVSNLSKFFTINL